jgi:hypothetical protein
VPLPLGGNGCRLFLYDELLQERCVLLQLLLLLLRLYVRVLWRGEAGKLERNPAQELRARRQRRTGRRVFCFWSRGRGEERFFAPLRMTTNNLRRQER